ncbi:Alpha/Beta hydrolase protein [Lactarius quietus]|nr:Alpha/Beta hydrolase protein [Lactarius quietus]
MSPPCSPLNRDPSPLRLPLQNLRDALNSPLPTPSPSTLQPPPRAVPPATPLSGSPPFLRSITRITLPVASLSNPTPAAHPFDPPDDPQSPGAPIFLQHSPPDRSSLDTLRSLRDRSSDANDRLLSEEDRAPTVEEEQRNIRKKYLSPKYPIVFCHGLLGFDSVTIGPAIAPLEVTHWRGIKEVLHANGIEVLMTRVPATSSPIERAKVLEQKIEEMYAGRSVHLIGHSMGGLDCRYLASNLHSHTFRVLSITTISSPHRGSSFADAFLKTVGPERFPSFLSLLDMLPNGGGDGSAFSCLTPAAMREFNEQTLDVPDIKYFSWGAVYSPGLIDTWKWPHSVILEKEGPNDGLVSIESAKWASRHPLWLEDVNHLDLVGWINNARYSWARLRGRDIKFHPATFYLAMADHLAREVDGVQPESEPVEEDPWDASSDRDDGDGDV